MPTTNNIAFTAPINPPGATPIIKREQVWAGLLLKIRSAETFVPGAIQSTTVVSESTDPTTGNPVTVREVIFREEDQRKVQETVTAYEDARVDFVQPDGSLISNVISEGAEDELYMTYVFEWRHPNVLEEKRQELHEKERKMSKLAVEGTIVALRGLVSSGKL